ncbi:outer membrane protein assembly factor BamD [Flavobacterium sp. TMP13]|uniref:outer membrane protein assembly factor BamD n=1 Tax=unclassified Flavobacterium TaxID=196869 RepID=UPI00076D06DF|nr:outer membrane protein assembly factor BamD [Flavobacterium sp. TAB 87]KVV15836.1 Outer membrane protein assembly factor BamD precursor [Flavobacterium sp. TAB 87]
MKKIVWLFALVVLLNSCSDYQKALKSDNVATKFALATELYEAGKYSKAIRLFEQLAPSYKGKPQAEKLFYMFSKAYYNTKQYYLAGYQFESFAAGYPRSEKVEEAAYLSAKSYSMLSPVYSLDQKDTYKAIEKTQNFIDNYPNSEYIVEANATMKVLTDKLEKKSFEIAKQYNTISDYKSALVAFDNFIADFPGTMYKEDALFYKYDSAYKLAINSVYDKMNDRLNVAKTSYNNLMKFNSETKYKEKAAEMNARIDTDLEKFKI